MRPSNNLENKTISDKQLANNFVFSDAEDSTSGPLNRGGIVDLPLLRTILAICQKFWEPSFWEKMGSFVLLVYPSSAASGTLLEWLLVFLDFTLNSEDLFYWYKQKVISMNCGISTSCWKPWRWVWLDLILKRRDLVHQFQPESTHKID